MNSETVSKKFLDYAIRHKYIRDEQYEEYLYILTMLLNILITDVTMLAIGFAMHMVWECALFWAVYKILRKYCGGLHFSTSLKCYLSSCVMCPIVLGIIKFVPFNVIVFTSLAVASTIFLFIFSPVEAVNKPLDEKEVVIFGKIARFLVAFAIAFYAAFILLKFNTVAEIISLSIICVNIFVMAGKGQLIYLKSHKEASV